MVRSYKNSSKKSSLDRRHIKNSNSLTKTGVFQSGHPNKNSQPIHKKTKESPYSSIKKTEPNAPVIKNEKHTKYKSMKKHCKTVIFDNLNKILLQNYKE